MLPSLPSPCITHINYIDVAPYISIYSTNKVRLPWKCWLEVAAKHKLCIAHWTDGIMPPGRDFDLKKLSASELRDLSGSYVDAMLNGNDNFEVFSVIPWSAGMLVYTLPPSQ